MDFLEHRDLVDPLDLKDTMDEMVSLDCLESPDQRGIEEARALLALLAQRERRVNPATLDNLDFKANVDTLE